MRSWVRMRSESTRALGQPRETKPTFGADGVVTVDIANLGIGWCPGKWLGYRLGAWYAADQKVRNSSGETED